jgi:hypothetical protein
VNTICHFVPQKENKGKEVNPPTPSKSANIPKEGDEIIKQFRKQVSPKKASQPLAQNGQQKFFFKRGQHLKVTYYP